MYCPNCGNKTSTELKFCRSCGLGLEKIAQSLSEQLPTELDESLQERKNRIERLGVVALSIFGVGVLSLILYGIVYKLILVEGRVLEGVGLLAFIVIVACGLLSVYLFAKADEVKEAKTKRGTEQAIEVPENTTAKLLPEGHLEPITSVTEHTTELLFAERKSDAKGN